MRFVSFLPGTDLFDAAAFSTSDAEALAMDPQQRLLLEAVGELLLAEAGGSAASGRRDVGVFVGLSSVDYMKVSGLGWQYRWQGGQGISGAERPRGLLHAAAAACTAHQFMLHVCLPCS